MGSAVQRPRVKPRVLVTGGAGFIGKHVVSRLLEEGHAVTVLDDLSSGSDVSRGDFESRVRLVIGDVRNEEVVEASMRDCESVIHLAARASVKSGAMQPRLMHDHNVIGTRRVFEAASRQGVRRVVFASSCAVYGRSTDRVQLEDAPLRPISAYGRSKAEAERLAASFVRKEKLDVVTLRLFNVYGAGQRQALVPSALRSVLENRPLTIYGDGSQTRDFVHVFDVARRICEATAFHEGHRSTVINLGSGKSRAVRSVVADMARLFEHRFQIRYEAERSFDIPASCAGCRRSNQVFDAPLSMQWEQGLLQALRALRQTYSSRAA